MILISNHRGEKLNTLVEEPEQPKATIVFVHGFISNKHETAGYFDDLSIALKNEYRLVRFDFSGCGKSEGKTEEITYEKHAEDLQVILEYVKKNYVGKTYILAHSMGCFVTALLSPNDIQKTVFTGIPNTDTSFIIERITERFGSRVGAKINVLGISEIPRSFGVVQKIGKEFWKSLREFHPVLTVADYCKKTDLLIIHPLQDDVVGTQFLEEYQHIPHVHIEQVDGDHSFTDLRTRKNLIERVIHFFAAS